MLHTFDNKILDEKDVLLGGSTEIGSRGYFVLFEDGPLRRIITRVCKSFMQAVYETSLQTVIQDLQQANAQKQQVRQLIAQS